MPNVAALTAAETRLAIDAALDAFCDRYLADVPEPVRSAIRYSLTGGGKRLRGILLIEAYRAAGCDGDPADLAAAVEVVHAYSLVHDDLPCMDDDDVRRGRPTVHRAYGVRAATVTGIAMVPLAAIAAFDAARRLGASPAQAGLVVSTLMRAGGGGGMIGGQLLDLDAEGGGTPLSLDALERIHSAKTGALIAVSLRLGGMAADASDDALDALEEFGRHVGHAFQIADDVLDVTATTDQLGKTSGKDAAVNKSTYPALLGVDGARRRAEALVESACQRLREAGLLTPALEQLARFAVDRPS